MGADATLVNMAYRAAIAKSPGDWSSSFDKQYEGIIAANQALANIGTKAIGVGKDITLAYMERREEERPQEEAILAAQELYKLTDDAGTSHLENSAAGNTYENGEGMNRAFTDAAYGTPTDIYNNITKINKKVFKTKEDKQIVASEYARLERWKGERIKDKANVKQLSNAINSGLINMDLMDPEYKVLLGQLLDQKGDFSLKGINIYNRESDDKLMVKFTPNRMESEHEYSKRMQEVDAKWKEMGYEEPPVHPEAGAPPKQKVGEQEISFEDLMGNVHYRELELQNNVYEGVTSFDGISGAKRKDGSFITSAWDDGSVNSGKAQATKMINNTLSNANQKQIADLATTDFFGTGSTYRKDLTNLVGGMDLSALGVEDKGEPGYEDDMKNSLLREEIVGRLIKPQTPSDLKFAREEMENYYIGMAEGVFNNTRNAISDAETTSLPKKGGVGKTPGGDEFKFAGAYTPPSDKFETGTWVTSSEQKRMYNSVINKLPTIDGADGYFYSLIKGGYLKWDSEKDYNTMRKHKASKKKGSSGVTSDKVSFDDILRFNAAGKGAPVKFG